MTVLFSWLHVSDLHAGHGDADYQLDQDLVLRDLLRDASVLPEQGWGQGVDALFVTGDVAFSGMHHQYDSALGWLRGLCDGLGIAPERRYVVPGNHDVDRGIAKHDPAVAQLLGALRDGESMVGRGEAFDRMLEQRFAAYTHFLRELAPGLQQRWDLGGCWEDRVPLGDGRSLRIVGLNTALLSQDGADRGRLRIGREQLGFFYGDPEPGTLQLLLGHHPIDWLGDSEDDRHRLARRSDLYLHGHTHRQGTSQVVGGGGDRSLEVVAAALHVDPKEVGALRNGHQFGALVQTDDGLDLRLWPRLHEQGAFRIDAVNVPVNRTFARFPLRSQAPAAAAPPPLVVPPAVARYRPPLAVYLAFEPADAIARELADRLYATLHLPGEGRALDLPVFLRSAPGLSSGSSAPDPVPWAEAERTAVVVITGPGMAGSRDWLRWHGQLVAEAGSDPTCEVIPVAMDDDFHRFADLAPRQFIRLAGLEGREREELLTHRVLHLLHRFVRAPEVGADAPAPPKVRVFLSHAKADGLDILGRVREFLEEDRKQLRTFVDFRDIADGRGFVEELTGGIHDPSTVLLTLLTDAFWVSDWCTREVLDARRVRCPIVAVDATRDAVTRAGEFLGRAPVIPWQPDKPVFWRRLLSTLLVEALRFAVVPEAVAAADRLFQATPAARNLPHPPTAEDFVGLAAGDRVAYPDPPMRPSEQSRFGALADRAGVVLSTPSTLPLVLP